MKKRLLSLFLAFTMIVSLLPATVLAGDRDTVYISAAHDGRYLDGLAYTPVALSELEKINLDAYGMGEFAYDEDGDEINEITALHLIIYAHTTLYGGTWDASIVSGTPGSSYLSGGLFGWDENMRYDFNGVYPADASGTGITSDQLVLSDGDHLDFSHYSSYSAPFDSATGFHYFTKGGGIVHEYTAEVDQPLAITLIRANSDIYTGTGTTRYEAANHTVYYAADWYDESPASVTTDDEGVAQITFDTAGTYYLWADGGYGNDNPNDIVSSPAYAKVIVTGDPGEEEEPAPELPATHTVTLPTETTGYTIAATENSTSPVTEGGRYSFTVTVAEGYDGTGMIVKANGEELTAVGGIYTISNITADQTVTVESVTAIPTTHTVTLPENPTGYTVAATEGSASPVTEGGSYSFTVTVADGYDGTNMVVKANETVLTADNGVYTISNITADQTVTVEGVVEAEEEESAPTPFSQSITVPANGDSSWGYVSGLTLSGSDGGIYETYWSSESNPYVLDVILTQGTPQNAEITAAFSVGGMLAPSISGETSVTLENGKGTISVTAVKGVSFYADTNWTINLTVDDGSAAMRPTYAVELPTKTVGYTVTASGSSASPVIEGRKFSFKVTIDGEYKKGENFKVLVNGEELTPSGDVYTITNITEPQTVTVEGVREKTLAEMNVTIIAPAGSTISSGRFYSYFKYDFNQPLETTTLEDGRLSYVFPVPGSQGFLRVQHPQGVTYWDFDGLNAGAVFEITRDMLFIGSDKFTKETVYADFEKNTMDKADLYLTANEKGWLDLEVGDTWNLNVFRNFLSLGNSISNSHVALPDMEYTVIPVNGATGVITVTPDANNSSYAEIKAEKAGTAILLVTYDAVYNNDGAGGKQWSALWPENTGVIVVTVGAEEADIQTNMTVNEEANAGGKQVIDAEHDILFYVGDAGAEYSFKPEDGCTVTVNRSYIEDNALGFNGFTASGVTTAEDGTVTVSGLTTGSHIVKVEKDGKIAYQVIRARQVSYELKHSDGTAVTAESLAQPGETITVQFHELISPLEKLSGIYNANFGFYYNGQDGDQIRTSGGTYGVYTFSGSEALQKFTFTVPSYWNELTYTLSDGAIKLGGFGGSFGSHRTTTYIAGKEVNTNASGTGGVAAVLPDIVVPVEPTGINVYYVTLPEGDGYTVTGGETPITEGGSYTFTVTVKGGYDGNGMIVKVNGEAVTLTDGSCTVKNVTSDLDITVEGVSKIDVETPAETTVVYTHGTDGSNWPYTNCYVNTVSIGGVTVENYTWDGNTCSVTLAENTPVNAPITFAITADGRTASRLTATLNGTAISVEAPCAVTLVDGTATVALYAKYNDRNAGTKTFLFTGAKGEAVTPAYAVVLPTETTGYTVTATEGSASPVIKGGSYSFTVTIADGYEAGDSFAVKVNGAALTAVDGVYTIENITEKQTVTVEGVETIPTWKTVLAKTQAYLTAQAEDKTPVVSSTEGEWQILGLARKGVSAAFFDAYYEIVKAYVAENVDANDRLHASKSTDNSRVILALTSIGKDVTDVAGHDLLKGLTHTDYVKTQGINGPIWALIALDSKDYVIPANADSSKQVTRDWLVEHILSKQLADGGWALSGTVADPDMTGMAVQALAPYYDSNAAVTAAVDKALAIMDDLVARATPEGCAQIIVARSALGLDSASALDKMLTFALEDGSFEKSTGSGANQMSTEQAFYALVAYHRYKNGQTALYDMSDVADLYPIEILASENGAITASKTSAAAGETITVTAQPITGYVLGKLTLNDVELTVTDNSAAFTMPEGTAILEATFTKTANAANTIAEAMLALDVEDAKEDTYELLEEIHAAYSSLTAAEKLEIREAYDAFMNQIDAFEEYLNEAVEEAAEELDWFLYDLDEDDYSKKAWDKIEDLYDEALDALEEARFEEEVFELLDDYLEELEEAAAGELEVTFRLIGDFQHDDGVDGHDEYVTWIETTDYNMPAGSTIYDLFVQAMDDFDLNQKGASKNYVESIQAPDILGGYWLGEFDNGPNSGWMYTINGDHPGYGLKEQALEDGDEVIWHYVDDYTLEERKPSGKYYERWLEADDIDPETWVKRNLDKIVEIEGQGEVTPQLKVSHIGKDVTFKFEPAEGWVIQTVYVDGKNKGAIESYKYSDLSMASRIEVVFTLANQTTYFVDVPETEWFYEDVQFVVGSGLFEGTGEYTFSPKASMTRAMLVTVLYRLEGEPAVYGSSTFSDAQSGQWYSSAVAWAARSGIVTGYDNGRFGVNDNVTREQMAAILYRYANYKGYDVTGRAYLNGYMDAGSISGYAVDALSWANAEGLVNGRTYNTLAPTGTANRAEVAAIFHRFVENIVK